MTIQFNNYNTVYFSDNNITYKNSDINFISISGNKIAVMDLTGNVLQVINFLDQHTLIVPLLDVSPANKEANFLMTQTLFKNTFNACNILNFIKNDRRNFSFLFVFFYNKGGVMPLIWASLINNFRFVNFEVAVNLYNWDFNTDSNPPLSQLLGYGSQDPAGLQKAESILLGNCEIKYQSIQSTIFKLASTSPGEFFLGLNNPTPFYLATFEADNSPLLNSWLNASDITTQSIYLHFKGTQIYTNRN